MTRRYADRAAIGLLNLRRASADDLTDRRMPAASHHGGQMHPPGWYRDAGVPGQERWWDGVSFTVHIRPAAAPPPLSPVPTGRTSVSARQRDIGVDLASGKNTHATVALVSALLSLLGWPIACVCGFTFGVLGLHRAGKYAAAGHPPLGRGRSVWALAISVVGTAVSVVAILVRLGYFL